MFMSPLKFLRTTQRVSHLVGGSVDYREDLSYLCPLQAFKICSGPKLSVLAVAKKPIMEPSKQQGQNEETPSYIELPQTSLPSRLVLLELLTQSKNTGQGT